MPTETATKVATRPRARKAATTVKAETPKTIKASALEEANVTPDAEIDRIRLNLDKQEDTKRYAKFTAPDGSGCVGSLYVPLGAKSVKVLIEM